MVSHFFLPTQYLYSSNLNYFSTQKCIRVTPLTIYITALNYNTMFYDRNFKTSLNSSFMKTQEDLKVSSNLIEQNAQTPS